MPSIAQHQITIILNVYINPGGTISSGREPESCLDQVDMICSRGHIHKNSCKHLTNIFLEGMPYWNSEELFQVILASLRHPCLKNNLKVIVRSFVNTTPRVGAMPSTAQHHITIFLNVYINPGCVISSGREPESFLDQVDMICSRGHIHKMSQKHLTNNILGGMPHWNC